MDLSLRNKPNLANDFQDNRPQNSQSGVFSGLPVATGGSSFQGYSGFTPEIATITAPPINYQPSRSTAAYPSEPFSSTATWQYMNLPFTITSTSASIITPENLQYQIEEQSRHGRFIRPPSPLLPGPSTRNEGQKKRRLLETPRPPKRIAPFTSKEYTDCRRVTSTHVPTTSIQIKRPVSEGAHTDWQVTTTVPKKRKNKVSFVDQPHGSRAIEGIPQTKEDEEGWEVNREHFLAQVGPVQTQVQARSAHLEMLNICREIIANTTNSKLEPCNGGVSINKYTRTDKNGDVGINRYTQEKGAVDTSEYIPKEGNHYSANCNSICCIKNTNMVVTSTSSLSSKAKKVKRNHAAIQYKNGKQENINELIGINDIVLYNVNNRFNNGNNYYKKHKKGKYHEKYASKKRKIHFDNHEMEVFKKPFPVKVIRSKIAMKPALPKTAVLPRSIWPIFRNTKFAKIIPKGLQDEDGDTTDTASDDDSPTEQEISTFKMVETIVEELVETAMEQKLVETVVKQPELPETVVKERELDESLVTKPHDVKLTVSHKNSIINNTINFTNSVFQNTKPVYQHDNSVFWIAVNPLDLVINSISGKLTNGLNNAMENNNLNFIFQKMFYENSNSTALALPENQLSSENNKLTDMNQSQQNEDIAHIEQWQEVAESGDFAIPALPLEPLWLLDIVAHDPQVEDFITGTPYTNNGEDGGSSYDYYRLTNFQLGHLRVMPDDRFWKAYVLDEIMLDVAEVLQAMPERKDELEAFSRELIIEALRRDYKVQNVESLRLCIINYLKHYPEFKLPLLKRLIKERERRE